MIREGEPDVTLKFLADSPSKLAISNFSDGTFYLASIETYILNVKGKCAWVKRRGIITWTLMVKC